MSDQQVAVVTGGASGIGAGIASALSADGLDVFVLDNNPLHVEAYNTSHALARARLCDVTSPQSVSDEIAGIIQVAGRIDVLVNNAGVSGPTAPVEDAQLDTLKDFAEFQVRLAGIRTNLSNLLQDFKQLQKKTERDLKNAQKNSNKRKRKTTTRQPSGFVKPTLISHELADFLGKAHGSELARTEVTREINSYIRANKLQDPSNGRRILADEKLKKLLALTNTDELTYFNLQKYMSPHFQKLGQELINGSVNGSVTK